MQACIFLTYKIQAYAYVLYFVAKQEYMPQNNISSKELLLRDAFKHKVLAQHLHHSFYRLYVADRLRSTFFSISPSKNVQVYSIRIWSGECYARLT